MFVVVKTRGDGYGHNSSEFISWHFDEDEAREAARAPTGSEFVGLAVEEVPAPEPIPEKQW